MLLSRSVKKVRRVGSPLLTEKVNYSYTKQSIRVKETYEDIYLLYAKFCPHMKSFLWDVSSMISKFNYPF